MPEASRSADDFDAQKNLGKLKAGALLLAQDMADPNFSATMVLLCQHSAEGSYGLVLNRPSHMPLSEVFDAPPGWVGSVGQRQRMHIGGPVQSEELQILQVTDEPVPGAYHVAPKVYLGGYWGEVKDVLDLDPKSTRLFLGYSGWGPDQLAKEVSAQAWDVWDVDVKKLLLSPEEAWSGGLGPIKAFLSKL